MTTLETLGMSRAEFVRGRDAGLLLGRAGSPLPPLHGGPYAVGLLFGYRSARRPHAASPNTRQLAG